MTKTDYTMVEMPRSHVIIKELKPQEAEFFDLIERSALPDIEQFLANNQVNINMKNDVGMTPLELAVQNNSEPLVELIIKQTGVRISNSAVLYAVWNDNLRLLDRLLDLTGIDITLEISDDNFIGTGMGEYDGGSGDDVDGFANDTGNFSPFMTPLLLASHCGRYDTVKYLLNRGHKLVKPHPPRCLCKKRCVAALERGEVVADGCKRLNVYQAISSPTFVCCTSPDDPILASFRLYKELMECGGVDRVYNDAYVGLANRLRQFAVELILNCRSSDEVKILLRNRDGCEFKGSFPYPRLITAMDHKQKEFVAHSVVQQVLESAWIGDWVAWKTYSTFWKCVVYPLWCTLTLPWTVALGVFAPNSELNHRNQLPINRMFNGLVTYSLFLILLFWQSNADKFTMRRGAPMTVTWWLIAVFVVGHAYEKFTLLWSQGHGRYYKNLWNLFDMAMLTLFMAAYVFWAGAEYRVQVLTATAYTARKFWQWSDPQLLAEGLFAVATVMAYLRLLFVFQINYTLGPMQVSIGKMLHDFAKIATFLVIIMAGFTGGLGNLYGYYAGMVYKDPDTGQMTQQEDSFVSLADTFKTLFWGVFCMTSLDAPNVVVGNCGTDTCSTDKPEQHAFTQFVGYGLFAVFEVLMVIVMLNMLIGAISDTFQRVAYNEENEWLFGRTEVYVSYMLLDSMPPPFNILQILNKPYQLLFGRKSYYSILDAGGDGSLTSGSPESQSLTTELIKRYFKVKARPKREHDQTMKMP